MDNNQIYEMEEYTSSIGGGHHGNIYKIKILTYLAQIKKESDLVWIECKENGLENRRSFMLQSSHRSKTENCLISENDLLSKYFKNLENKNFFVRRPQRNFFPFGEAYEQNQSNEAYIENLDKYATETLNDSNCDCRKFIEKYVFIINAPTEDELDQIILKEIEHNTNLNILDLIPFRECFFKFVSDLVYLEIEINLTLEMIEEFYHKIWQCIPEALKLREKIILINQEELKSCRAINIVKRHLLDPDTITIIDLYSEEGYEILKAAIDISFDLQSKLVLISTAKLRTTMTSISDNFCFKHLEENSKNAVIDRKILIYENDEVLTADTLNFILSSANQESSVTENFTNEIYMKRRLTLENTYSKESILIRECDIVNQFLHRDTTILITGSMGMGKSLLLKNIEKEIKYGLDEIMPLYTNLILTFIRNTVTFFNNVTLILASRPLTEIDLGQYEINKVLKLQSVSDEEQINYLTEYCIRNIPYFPCYLEHRNLTELSSFLIKRKFKFEFESSVTSTPLLLHVLARELKTKIENIDQMNDNYMTDALALSKVFSQEDLEFIGIFYDIQSKLNNFFKRCSSYEEKYGVVKINEQQNKTELVFIHSSYVEYFVAKYFCSSLRRNFVGSTLVRNFLLSDILVRPCLKTVRTFCDEWFKMQSITELSVLENLLNSRFGTGDFIQAFTDLLKNLLKDLHFHICIYLIFYLNQEIRTNVIHSTVDDNKNTLLHYAAEYDVKNLAEHLVEYGVDVNLKNKYGLSSVHVALKNDYNICGSESNSDTESDTESESDVYDYFEFKTNNDEFCKNALIAAAYYGNVRILNDLLKSKLCEKNDKDSIKKSLLEAAICGHLEVIKILWCQFENINDIRNNVGDSILVLACKFNNSEIVKYLLYEKNVELDIPNYAGETSLIVSVKYGYSKLVKILIEKGANVNAQDNLGNSSLIIASKENCSGILKNLLQHGADKSLQNDFGETALFLATENGFVTLLLKNESKDSKGSKQYYYAIGTGHHGNLYQIKFLMYSTLIADNKGYRKFKISTERSEFGKFDDIAIEYSTDSNICDRLILMQAKHIQNPKQNLLTKAIMANPKDEKGNYKKKISPFCIFIYFESYIKFYNNEKYGNIIDKIDGIYILTNTWFQKNVHEYFTPNNSKKYFDFGEAYELNDEAIKLLKKLFELSSDLKASPSDYEQFQKKFVFIVKTPSEAELDNYIEEEIKNNLQINYSELKVFSTNFFYFVSDMFCQEKKTYLTFNKIKELYIYFKLKLSTLNKFKKHDYRIQFSSDHQLVSDLTKIFESNDVRKIFIKTSNFSITKYGIWQCIPEKYKLNEKIILVTERDIKSENLFKVIAKNFDLPYTITIIESMNKDEENMKMKWITEAEGHPTSKLILISTFKLSGAKNLIYDDFSFLSLDENSKNRVLNFKIEFLHEEMTLKEIFQNYNTIINDDKWLPCDTLNVILDLMRKENNGEKVKRFSILKNYPKTCKDCLYIKRKLILKDTTKLNKIENNEDLIVPEESIFNYFSNFDNIIIVTAIMGMGKSLLLESIEEEFKRKCKIDRTFDLVARIDLLRFQNKVFDNFRSITFTKEKTFEFLLECFAFGTTTPHLEFVKNVIEYHLYKGNPLLLIDGFDEVAPIYTELIMNFINSIRRNFRNVRLIIASRPNIEKDFIKHKFQHFFNIKNFSEDQQINYLMKSWGMNVILSKHIPQEILRKLAVHLVKFKLISKSKNKITGIPLLIYMFSHIYESKMLKYIKNLNVFSDRHLINIESEFEDLFMKDVKEDFNLIVLYDQFMENQIEYHYKEKELYDVKGNLYFSGKKSFYKEFFEDHEALALLTVFSKSDLKQMGIFEMITERCQYLIKRISKDEHKFGIIRFLQNKEDLYFMHLSYAEYFVAKFLCKSLQRNIDSTALITKFFITTVLGSPFLMSVTAFCDEWLKIHSILEIRSFAILKNSTTFMDEILEEQADNLNNYHAEALEYCIKGLVRLFQFNIAACLLYYLNHEIRAAIVNRNIDEHENKILHYAAEHNETVLVENLIEYGADISMKNVWGSSCLYIALKNRNFEIAKLVEKCYTIGNTKILEFKTFLYETVIRTQCDKVLLESSDVDMVEAFTSNDHESQIHEIERHSGETIESYITLKNLNVACELFDKLITKISQMESSNYESFCINSFIMASRYGNSKILNYLLKLKLHNKKAIEISLLEAAIYGHLHILKILLNEVENVNEIRNNKGNSLLSLACQFNYCEIVEYLLNNVHIEVDLKNNNNETALMLSAKYGYCRFVNNLIEKGANINAQDKHGNSALIIASKENYPDILEILLRHGALKDLQNLYSETALFLATECGHSDCVEVLLRYAADSSIENKFDETALFVAIIRGVHERAIYKRNTSIDVDNINFNDMQIYKFYHNDAYQAPHTYDHLKFPFSNNRNDHRKILDLLVTHNASISFKKVRTSLFTAAEKGFFNVVKLFIDQQLNIDVEDFGLTALQIATRRGWYDICKILLEAGARIEVYKNSALCEAANYNRLDIAKLLIAKGARIDFRDSYKDTPLTQASRYNYTDLAKLLLENGADPNAQNMYKETPLSYAASNSNIEIFNALFESGVEVRVNVKDDHNKTPIYYAALKSNYEMVYQLIASGAYLNSSHDDTERNNHDDDEYDSDVDDPSIGDTILLAALANNNCRLVELLVNRGAEINTPNKAGTTPLSKAVYKGYYDIVKFLIQKKADCNWYNENGENLLHVACREGFIDITILLISNKVDINKRNKNNETPIFVASDKNHYEIVRLFIEHGADINVETLYNETPLSIAIKNNHKRIVKILRKNGAIESFVNNIAPKNETEELSLYVRYLYSEQNVSD
ncbi:uncharacterized protein LOC129614764 [Condylostylus longicornis]|uniref:uncharacterized protein LOC129614764 n=1 Tax=Condylostylus longicornis TaxID=2530218 RepID=UPI00244E53E7|nr:uncharacterized protein LOC129614764 [Condylostylus longicornis]